MACLLAVLAHAAPGRADEDPARATPGDAAPAAPDASGASGASGASEPVAPAATAPPSAGQHLTGQVSDQASGAPLPAATLQIEGGATGPRTLATELDGSFALDLAPGTYQLTISTPEYVAHRRTITVGDAGQQAIDVALSPEPRVGKEEVVEVYSQLDTRKDSAVLAERRAAATVSDAISAQQISRSADSTASDATRRIVAATVQDNRYVVIRGLGGRYSTTLLNGVPLPSPDPDVPAAPLDLFPAALITNLTVAKTFSPDLPGNFAGGALGVETRAYPSRLLFKARVGIGSNSESSFRTLNGQAGGSLDLLGFDTGTRALPDVIPGDRPAGDLGLSPAERNAQIAAFRNNWSIRRGTAGPNLSLGATIGDTHKLADQRLGYFASVSYSHAHSARQIHLERVGGQDGEGGRLPSVLQLDDRQGLEHANLSAVGASGWTPASGHKVDLFALYAHTADISSSEITGTDNSTAVIDRTRLQFLARELLFSQLVGEHRLAERAVVEWQAHVARVAQHEPDTRDLQRTSGLDGRYAISTSAGSSERLFGELSDLTLGGGAALLVPLERIRLKAGAAVQRSARDYQTRRFHFDLTGDAVFMAPDQAFAPANAGNLMSMTEVTQPSDGYAATRLIASGYALADLEVTPALRVVAGARLEAASLGVGLESKLNLMTRPTPRTERDDLDLLPAVNVVYSLSPTSQLRAAYAMTVARPNFREIAPAIYFDYVRRRVIGGNPGLVETKIQNADLRWETFLGDSELVAASVFAKRFADPIERTVEIAGDGDNIGFANSPTATTYGLELEARLSLGRVAPALAAFSVAGNLSLIGSQIDVGGGATRSLQGQSPYVANLGLGYEHAGLGTRVDLAYNAFGRRIEEVGTGGAGDVYEEPFHRLDLTVSQPLQRHLRFKLAGTNLLDQRVVRTQDAVEIFAYRTGVSVVGSVEYSVE